MKTRVIQDDPKPAEAPPPAPEADRQTVEQAAAGARVPEQKTNGAKP